MPEYLPPDEGDVRQETGEVSPSALAILNQSEHAAMVQTANLPANRRKLKEFEDKLMAYANHSQQVALGMFYSLPRAGKQIIGASIRFAEVVAPCWKNCAVASRVVGDGTDTVTAQGIFIDYEANLRNSIEVPRRITDKNGNRFNADMIVTTSNAAMSIARRNAVLKGGVPQALWSPAYEAAQLTAVGKAVSHSVRVAEAMDYLFKLGVTEWQAMNAVGCASPKDLETEHLVTLRVLCQEIKRGEKTIEQVFGSPHDKEIDALFAQLGMNATQQRLLRESYMGKAADLLDYLKGRLSQGSRASGGSVKQENAPSTTTTTQTNPATETQTNHSTETQTATSTAPPVEVKRSRGRPSKEEMARRAAAAAAQQQAPLEHPQTMADVVEEGNTVTDQGESKEEHAEDNNSDAFNLI